MSKLLLWTLTCVLLLAVAGGCRRKPPEAKTELEKTADLLSKGQPEPAPAPAAAAPEPTPAPVPEPSLGEPAAAVAVPPAQQMRQALAAYKTGQLEDAVTRLQRLRSSTALTAQQRMAVQDSVAAVMNEVYEMAAKGDARAIQAVRQYEEMQTRPR